MRARVFTGLLDAVAIVMCQTVLERHAPVRAQQTFVPAAVVALLITAGAPARQAISQATEISNTAMRTS